MINFFTGRPGNGKSLHMAMIIDRELKKGHNVIANFEINMDLYAKYKHPEKLGKFIYVDNRELMHNAYKGYVKYTNSGTDIYKSKKLKEFSYIDGLIGYAQNFHKKDKQGRILENQTILVIDECQELFNSRTYMYADRLQWCNFFRQHRKYGFDVYLISQDDKCIDKQIRSVLQYEYEHRCVDNYKLGGKVISILMMAKTFICIKRIYGMRGKDSRINAHYFTGQKRYYNFYNSYKIFDNAMTIERDSAIET